MKIRFWFTSYSRPLPRPIITAHGIYATREGIIVRAVGEDGIDGIGEAAPLPGFSAESIEDLRRTLEGMVARASSTNATTWDTLSRAASRYPSLNFAIETAQSDAQAKRQGVSMARLFVERPAARIAVNGLLGIATPEYLAIETQRLWESGCGTCKMKVGSANPEDDTERIRAVHDSVPGMKLRLDANAGWSQDHARYVLSRTPIESIDFLEQPYPFGHVNDAQALCAEFGLRLALDEEANTVEAARKLIQERACDVLVLKPMVLGSLTGCNELGALAQANGIDAVYTSSWESDIGISATLHLAAALGPDASAMGLATAGMVSDGIVSTPLRIVDGFMAVPEGSGLGIELTPDLARQLR